MSTVVATTKKKDIGERSSRMNLFLKSVKNKKEEEEEEILWILFHLGFLVGLGHKIMVAGRGDQRSVG